MTAHNPLFSARTARFVRGVAFAYPAAVIVLFLVMNYCGDSWWPATVLLFSPRWLAAVPLVLLVPVAAVVSFRLLVPVAVGGLIVLGPFMGLNLPSTARDVSSDKIIRLITCNIDNGRLDVPALETLIRDVGADIVCLQEFKQDVRLNLPAGWQVVNEGGLAILSRFPLRMAGKVQVANPPNPWPSTCLLRCTATTPGGDITVCSVQLPTPRFGLLTLLDRYTLLRPSRNSLLLAETGYRQRASREVVAAISGLPGRVIIAGDFNMPTDSTIYRENWSGYTNAFSRSGFGYGWTQRARSKQVMPIGIRIDHVLVTGDLRSRLCEVAADVGSDHLPLVADIAVVQR